jgi:predicted enzyme related to lactoylglutathione lyase
LIVTDRKEAEDFFVRVFDVTATERLQTDSYDEVVMDFGDGMFVALFEPTDEAPLPKSEHPVVAIYSTAADDVLERVKAEGLGVQEFGGFMFLATDPSGNVIEVVRQRTP